MNSYVLNQANIYLFICLFMSTYTFLFFPLFLRKKTAPATQQKTIGCVSCVMATCHYGIVGTKVEKQNRRQSGEQDGGQTGWDDYLGASTD